MNINVVLVRPKYARNIGATARAMANLGAGHLILIDPKCEVDDSAHQGAAGAQEQLRSALTYPSLQEFYLHHGHGIRIGMTRRSGKKRLVLPLPDALSSLTSESIAIGEMYLFFGPEVNGLDAEDLAFMNFTCHLPVSGPFASLNLAQAVLLTLYIVREKFPNVPKVVSGDLKPEGLKFPDSLIKNWLTSIGFDIDARKASAYLTLRRLILQNQPTPHETHVLEAILQQTVRKLEETRVNEIRPD